MIRLICVASILLLLLVSCQQSLVKYSDKDQNLKIEDIKDKWVYIDTSKMLFAKMDLKKRGYCSISIGFGKEIARFFIDEIGVENGYIRLKLMNTEDSIPEEFVGTYDFDTDSLDLKLGSIDNRFVFIKVSKLNEKLFDIEKSLTGGGKSGPGPSEGP